MSEDYLPPAEAVELGHELEWDPGRLPRYTCTRCGAAALKATAFWYGTAIGRPCASAQQAEPNTR